MRILIVDDDTLLLRSLTIGLQAHGHSVVPAGDGRTALDAARHDDVELVVLDLGLPDLSGIEVLRDLRTWSTLPVLVLSARTDSAEKVRALDLGADDYVTKPFSMDELLARIRVLERRHHPTVPRLEHSGLIVDFEARTAVRDGCELALTPTEWRLLEVLARTPGRLVPYAELLAEVWGPAYVSETHYLRVYAGRLRKKLEADAAHPTLVVTVPGEGLRLDVPASSG